MPALIRLFFAFAARFVPFFSVAGSFFTLAWTVLAGFVSGSATRLWYWGLVAVSFLTRFAPLILFVLGVSLVSGLLLSVVAFVFYHVNAFLTLGLSPYVTVGTVRIISNSFLGVLSFYLIRFAAFLGTRVADAVPVPQAPVTGTLGISALRK